MQDIQRLLAWLGSPYQVLVCTGADVNCDGVFGGQDALLILLHLAGTTGGFPPCSLAR
jgi:hypothetical protein